MKPEQRVQRNLQPKKNHVLILTSTRCGSSFLGQLFNYHPDVFYLYEPVVNVKNSLHLHLQHETDRRQLLSSGRDVLRNLFKCNLYVLENYLNPPKKHILENLHRRGANKAFCSPPVCYALKHDMVSINESECVSKCGPLNLTLATDSCQGKGNVVIKEVFMTPRVDELRDLLEDSQLNLKVIQLVRDPRAILASRLAIRPPLKPYSSWRILNDHRRKQSDLTLQECGDFLRSVSVGLSWPQWLRGRYMVLRYEDLTQEPLQKLQEIYEFVGLSMDQKVMDWIEQNTKESEETTSNSQYSTKRNSSATAENWRKELSYAAVEHLQNICQKTLNILGYKLVRNPEELKNMSLSLIEDKQFMLH
ncbi:carbohydrate sulfotransferase 1-like [Chanos chanos]|uniref:Sulfotransferase n=1 Tax=Chanos chanos TaxID=29144 RepID=A0A6J2USI9_CHACN|nr:carbohydrate sulfotransferase 1-like [Chanos chanos]